MLQISIVLTVYNKAAFLPATLASLLAQDGVDTDFALNFILVDDASTDASVAAIEAFFTDHPARFTVLRNARNAGPAIRLNQGIRAAGGDYIFVFDADDIAPRNVLQTMLHAVQRKKLDYVYGRSKKTTLPATEAAAKTLPDTPQLLCSNTPLLFTLQHGLVQPVVLAQRDVMLRSGGADERIFVQDESLALHLALAAHRIGLLPHPCRYVLQPTGTQPDTHHLSANRSQQHHDQYLAYTHVLDDPHITLTVAQRAWLARKAVAPWWKSARQRGFPSLAFCAYVLSKLLPNLTLNYLRSHLDRYFSSLADVRRISPDT